MLSEPTDPQHPRDPLCLMPGSHLGSARAVTQRTALGANRHSFETLSFSAAFVPALKFGPVLHLYSFLLCQQTLRFVRCPHHHAPRQMARAAPRLHGGRAVFRRHRFTRDILGGFRYCSCPLRDSRSHPSSSWRGDARDADKKWGKPQETGGTRVSHQPLTPAAAGAKPLWTRWGRW